MANANIQPDYQFCAAVGVEIRRLRDLEGWTLREVEEYSGIPSSTWSGFERNGPPMWWLPLIAETLGVGPVEIIENAHC